MRKPTTPARIALLAFFALAGTGLASCDLDFVGEKKVDEDSVRNFYFSPAPNVIIEASQRLLAAIDGTPVQGVTLVPNGSRVDATIDLDFDQDGSMETMVTGGLQFANDQRRLADGATLSITGVEGNPVDGSLNAQVTMPNPTAISLDGDGVFEGRKGSADIDLQLTVNPSTGVILGSVDIDGGDVSATAFYEDDGFGGFMIRVVGEDFEFSRGGY